MNVIILVLVAFGVALLLTWWFSRPASRLYILDHPNERSLHSQPVPRTGGVAVLLAIFSMGIITMLDTKSDSQWLLWLAIATFLVAAISFIDDLFSISVPYRFFVHCIAAAALIYAGFGSEIWLLPGFVWNEPAIVVSTLSFIYLIWVTNLYNFMDGMDGFAGGMSLIGFGTFALLGWSAFNESFAIINAIIAASAAGFLVFNFPPARMFMGDTGSSTLGLLAAALTLWASQEGIFPFWIGILIFSPFLVDATATVMRRAWQRDKIWKPHRTHYYQRLVRLGWSHKKTVLYEYILMVLCASSAVWAQQQQPATQWWVIIIWVVGYAIFIYIVHALESRTSLANNTTRQKQKR